MSRPSARVCREQTPRLRGKLRGSSWRSRSETGAEGRRNQPDGGLWEESKPNQCGNEQDQRYSQRLAEVANILPPVRHCSHERGAIGAQHINSGNDYSPEGQDGCDLEKMKAGRFPTFLERPKENQDFR